MLLKKIIFILLFLPVNIYSVSVYDIQFTEIPGNDGTYPSPYEGQTVSVQGIVTGNNYSNGRFFISSLEGGVWNGIYIYSNDYNVETGDLISITGEVYEYRGMTELKDLTSFDLISSGNALPSPVTGPVSYFHNEEGYEGVYISITDVTVSESYDQYDEWRITSENNEYYISTGFINLKDIGFPIIENYPIEKITGLVSYSYGEYRLNPRNLNDLHSAPYAYIVSVPDTLFTDSEVKIPIHLSFLGEEQQIQSFSFIFEFDSEIITFENIITDNTLSENGEIVLTEINQNKYKAEFTGDFQFSGKKMLALLNFTGETSGEIDFNFDEFNIQESQVEYFYTGEMNLDNNFFISSDTLRFIQKPILNIPSIVRPSDILNIECLGTVNQNNWQIKLKHNRKEFDLSVISENYDYSSGKWHLSCAVPEIEIYELYDLEIVNSDGETDFAENSVKIIPEFKNEYSFIHITDTHLPNHRFYPDSEALTDTSEIEDFRQVIRDVNLLNPEFVLLTGDLINEGEMEEFQNRKVYTISKALLKEFEVPVFLVSGNHDIGGWYDSPPPAGTARSNWWKFFGWLQLQNPPESEPYYTQNYSFNYGDIHYIGMESYINYDDYMFAVYGDVSFTSGQMDWLSDDLYNSAEFERKILFYHYDFSEQIDLNSMGLDMVLYGHIHSDAGSIGSPPFNIATDNVCDGDRAYRLIKINGTNIDPQPTKSAGWYGDNIDIAYSPSNNGEYETVTAEIENNHNLQYDNILLKFKMPKAADYTVSNGVLSQIDSSYSEYNLCYVNTDLPSYGNIQVILNAQNVDIDEEIPSSYYLKQNRPNPFNPNTVIEFGVTEPGHVNLSVYNILGEHIITLADSLFEKGNYKIEWNGLNSLGNEVPSGIYFYRLESSEFSETKKMILLK